MLLIDEIDRADDDFEAFLLELLAEAAVTIPELGTVRATHPPVIVLTSNRTRDLHDAVKRRCLYQWIDYPTPEREIEIVRRRVQGASESLAVQVVAAVAKMRDSDMQKPPGIAEAIDWLRGARAARRRARSTRRRSTARSARCSSTARTRTSIRAAGLETLVGASGLAVETVELDLPRSRSPRSARRLHEAGVPVTPERSARFAEALALTRPVARTAPVLDGARGVRVRPRAGEGVRRVFFEVFGSRDVQLRRAAGRGARARRRRPTTAPASAERRGTARPAARRAGRRGDGDGGERARVSVVPVAASDEERLRGKRFDALEPGELARAVPADDASSSSRRRSRRTRRAERDRRGERIDLRRTLRGSLRTGGDPIRLAHRRRRVVRRRIVLLCDISGSMEPYARAYLQFLTCAGAGRRRGVRVRHAADPDHARARHAQPGARDPARRRRRAGLVVSGTRIGDALQRVQRPPRPPRDGARRGDRDPLRRLGARRPRAGRPRDGAAGAARVPDRVGQPARRGAPGSRRGSAAWRRRCRTSTRWSPATAWTRCTRWSTRSAPSARAKLAAPEPEEEEWASATPVAGSSRGDAQRLRPEPRKDDARMDL